MTFVEFLHEHFWAIWWLGFFFACAIGTRRSVRVRIKRRGPRNA